MKRKFRLSRPIFYLASLCLVLAGLWLVAGSTEQAQPNPTAVYRAAVHYLFHLPTSEMGTTAWQTIYISPRQTFDSYTSHVVSGHEGDNVPTELLSALSDLAPHIAFGTVESLLPPGHIPQLPDGTIVITLSPIDFRATGTAQVDVQFYRGATDSAGYTVDLVYDGKNWSVQKVQMSWIS